MTAQERTSQKEILEHTERLRTSGEDRVRKGDLPPEGTLPALSQITQATGPYPGLRPFDDDEAEIFFGREEQTDQLLEKLQRSHFIAVVGPSGCGKSSLVRAGMIAALESGFLAGTGTGWRIAEMRPGDRPLARLADALLAPSALGPERGRDASEAAIVQAMLRRGPLGLLEILRETPLPKNSNLLLLVDQFEEIFRFRKQGSADEADAFVALLLATVAQREVPVYVVITMRSDFLGDCALFTGLPEAINDGQYLTPRLSREQIRAAITGPARVFGGEVEPALVNHLLNEIGPDPDQLPLLQHALMRMWASVHDGSRPDGSTTPSTGTPGSIILTMADYQAIGSLSEALSRHADQVLASLTERQQEIARALLTRLTERGADKRDTRRPTRLDDVAAVADATDQDIIAVVERLRQQGCSFLTPPPPVPLTPSTVLDIGHESLIRQWRQLYQWVEAEAVAATRYRRFAERAELNAKGDAGLMTDSRELSRNIKWREEWPNAAWASRYHPGFEAAEVFLRKSRSARGRRRLWRIAGIVGAAMLIGGMVVLASHNLRSKQDTARARRESAIALLAAARDSALADTARAERAKAVQQRDLALAARAEADSARRVAEALNRKFLSQIAVEWARGQLQPDPDSALFLAVKAFGLDPTPEAEGILQQSLLARRPRAMTALGANLRGTGSADGRFVAIPDSQGSVRVWETASGRQVAGPIRLEGRPVRAFFSPHGDILGVLTDPGRITLWDTRTWGILSTLQGPLSPRQFPSLSYDSRFILASGADKHARIWETATGKEVGQIGADSSRISVTSFSPNGKYILTSDSISHVASLWDAGSRELVRTLACSKDRPVLGGRFSPDSRLVLLTPVDNRWAPTLCSVNNPEEGWELQGVDTAKGQPAAVGPPAFFPPLASFNPNGTSILAVSGDVIRLWRNSSDRRPIVLKAGGAVRNARFSQDGRLILSTGGDGTATLWDVGTGEKVGSFSGGSITSAWLSADSRRLLTTSTDSILREWGTIELGASIPLSDLPDKADPLPLESGQEFPAGITPNGKYLLARTNDRTARIWEVSTGHLKVQLGDENTADRASFSPDGRRAITSAEQGAARVWDVETGKPVASLEREVPERSLLLGNFGDDAHPWVWYRGEKDASIAVWSLKDGLTPYASVTVDRVASCVTVSPDALWLVTCEEGGEGEARVIHARRLPSGSDEKLLGGHTGTIIDVFFSQDGRFAASTSYDKTALIWEVGTWRLVAKLSPHEAGVQYAYFSPDSREVATIDDAYTLRVWETATGKPISELRGHTDRVTAFAFSGDGRWLLSGSEDNTARIWDSRTGQSVAVLYGHTGPIIAVAFIQGSQIVVTASADGTIRRYRCDLCVPTSELLSLAGQRMAAIRKTAPPIAGGKAAHN